MEDLIYKVDDFIAMLIAVLLGLQALVNYFLSPEKAKRFNFIGKALELLSKTKAGLSARIDK